jgi:hypothetical protein
MRTIELGRAAYIGGGFAPGTFEIGEDTAKQLATTGYVPWRQTGRAILTRHSLTQDFWIGTADNPRQCRMMGINVVKALTSDDMGRHCPRLA